MAKASGGGEQGILLGGLLGSGGFSGSVGRHWVVWQLVTSLLCDNVVSWSKGNCRSTGEDGPSSCRLWQNSGLVQFRSMGEVIG